MLVEKITSSDQLSLQVYYWKLRNPVKRILLVHGYAEHALRYADFAELLNSKGIELLSFDLRGHGRSDGLRAYIPRFELLLEDLKLIASKYYSGKDYILLGHSMGGLIAVQYVLQALDPQPQSLISSSAALALDKEMSPLLQKLAPLLGYLLPKFPTQKLNITYLTRNEEVYNRYVTDPLVYRGGTRARTAAEILRNIRVSATRFSEITIRLFVIHGLADRLTIPEGSVKLYEEAKSNDKTLKLYEGCYHELLNEPEKDKVIQDVLNWIEN